MWDTNMWDGRLNTILSVFYYKLFLIFTHTKKCNNYGKKKINYEEFYKITFN